MAPGPRVLVVRFSSLGDVVLITPLLRAIRRRHPAAHITVLTRARYAELFEDNPAVDGVIPFDPAAGWAGLWAHLAPARYDVRLDLQDSPRSRRLRRRLGGSWGVAPRRRAARLALIWFGWDRYLPPQPVAESYFVAARSLEVQPDGKPPEVFPSPADLERAAALVPQGCVILAPGASRAAKRWPPEAWRALARQLQHRGHTVAAVGDARERVLLEGEGIIAAYALPLRQTAAVLARARVVIGNDSGLLHLATAVSRPVVAIFGPTVPAFGYAPYGVPAGIVQQPLACRPCSATGGDHCPLGHHRCMIDIEPEAVLRAMEQVA